MCKLEKKMYIDIKRAIDILRRVEYKTRNAFAWLKDESKRGYYEEILDCIEETLDELIDTQDMKKIIEITSLVLKS